MDNIESGLAMVIKLWLNDPHACICVVFITVDKPIDQCAREGLLLIFEQKEKKDPPDFHALHAQLRSISDNEGSVMTGVAKEVQSRSD
jgi:hypothetical protein